VGGGGGARCVECKKKREGENTAGREATIVSAEVKILHARVPKFRRTGEGKRNEDFLGKGGSRADKGEHRAEMELQYQKGTSRHWKKGKLQGGKQERQSILRSGGVRFVGAKWLIFIGRNGNSGEWQEMMTLVRGGDRASPDLLD